MRDATTWPALALALLLLTACGGEPESATGAGNAGDAARVAQITAARHPAEAPVAGVVYGEHGEPAGLHRYRRWSAKVGQGAQPEGDVAFANLRALGYKNVLSVDGSTTDVDGAAKYGLRYVHVPIGYDGITAEAALSIAKATVALQGPIYVHCHHGKHRGPAAAMLCRVVADGISADDAAQGLAISGTSPNYTGLWRDVKAFTAPAAEALATLSADDLPSRVMPQGLRASMVKVSGAFERLVLCQAAGWKVPPGHPDVDPPHEARMLWELYREMARTDAESKEQGEVFLGFLASAEREATALEEALRQGDAQAANERFEAIKNLCNDCHTSYRN